MKYASLTKYNNINIQIYNNINIQTIQKSNYTIHNSMDDGTLNCLPLKMKMTSSPCRVTQGYTTFDSWST